MPEKILGWKEGIRITSDNNGGDVIILKIPSRSRIGIIHDFIINKKTNNVRCTCESFKSHGYCGHTNIYKKITAQILYGAEFTAKIIQSFNNCYDFVIDLCNVFPECIADYDQLDKISESVLLSIDKHYKTETIHRSYRLAVSNGEIIEPEHVQIRREKTEQIMHQLPKWNPGNVVNFSNGQTSLFKEER